MRILFVTLQFIESGFYGEVAAELGARGHEPAVVTVSHRAASKLRRRMVPAHCLADVIAAEETDPHLEEEIRRLESTYATPTLRDVYRTDPPSRRRPERWCLERTTRHFRAMERTFDAVRPDVVVLDVGGEILRTAAHLIALERGVPVLFLFYTIFPQPLRLYKDTMHAPIVTSDEIRPVSAEERLEVEAFIEEFIARDRPIRDYRRTPTLRTHWRNLIRHVVLKLTQDRDNEYLRPDVWARDIAVEAVRRRAATFAYRSQRPGRPFVYFPLHVADDYKIARVIPHCSDQASIIEQFARSLPAGYDLVVKEHPMAIGQSSLRTLARLARIPNVQVLPPDVSSHDLIRDSSAVGVISSTVGLEALLHAKPVLTLGRPFYAGAGVTLDVDSFAELREAVPALLRFKPDRERTIRFLVAAMRRCHPGAPVLVDRSHENALRLAGTLDSVVRLDLAGEERPVQQPSRG
jgi:hypothetical protein